MKTFKFNIPYQTYEQIQYLKNKWSKDEIDYEYTIPDIIRVCIGTVFDTEIKNSLKNTLTKSSKS